MFEFHTAGFNGFSVKYSPFHDARIAVGTGANFGLVGNGRLFVLGLNGIGMAVEKVYDTQDVIHDVAWSEIHDNQLVAGCGDGSIKLFDVGIDQFPVAVWAEHAREVFSVNWNLVTKDTFLSSSWDGTVKIWSPMVAESIATLPIHSCTYSAAFSPHDPNLVSAASSDSHLRIFDLRMPPSASNQLALSIPVHTSGLGPGGSTLGTPLPAEILTHDWNRYRDSVIAVGGVDKLIRLFDIRAPGQPAGAVMGGHEYAVRKIGWSPHSADILLSASYDMTCRIWTDGTAGGESVEPARQVGMMAAHTEFVTGLDWCLFGTPGWVATCGWDERVLVWDAGSVMSA